jgi:ectoine hydroxylase-related dioxygenase (phytanoyl-CoA dioxygenase family)
MRDARDEPRVSARLAGAARAASPRRHGVDEQRVSSLLAAVHERGYVIIPEIVPHELRAAIKAAARPFLQYDGRNEFEGYKTRRIYSVIEKTLACNPLVEHPLILALLDRILLPNYLLSQLQVIDIHPGEVQQPLHHDDGFYPFPRPRPAFSAATIWAIDDFTEENGATRVLPKSHLWGDRAPADSDHRLLVPVVMPAGSVVFFLGRQRQGPQTASGVRRIARRVVTETRPRQVTKDLLKGDTGANPVLYVADRRSTRELTTHSPLLP